MKTISLHALKYTLRDIHENTESRKFCFVIGAGASYKSGIPTGGQLAEKWFKEVKERCTKEELEQWIKEVKLNKKDLAAHYGSIYRKRFENDKTSGYEFLVQSMQTAKPTFGHFVLAQILVKASGNCILTTNFDSLIESSIYQYTDKTPLVCGHESLSGYARPSNIHPLIIKIHRDLLLSPKSDPDEINTLDKGWKEPLDNIFSSHIPIVIGYGGNDGSLMDYFEKMNKPSNFFWCGHKGAEPSSRVVELLERMDGSYIDIDGFDEMMKELLWVFPNIGPVKEELDKVTKSRIDGITTQLNEMNPQPEIADSPKTETKKELSALEYYTMADGEPDYEKRKAIYLEALDKFPKTAWLWNAFIYFLQFIKKDYSNLEEYYLRALSADPEHLNNNGNYALFLENIKKDHENAEKHYLKALSIDSEHATINENYAKFLQDIKKDYEKAEKHYLKALSSDPANASNNESYALFLENIKKDYENAEKHYLKALFIDPEDANINRSYATFLKRIKKDYDNAEKHYIKALSIDPENANNNGGYAVFLKDIKKDYENAEKHFLKALFADLDSVAHNGNYALFLECIKKDYEKAEKYYLKALSIDPENANSNVNYAVFLKDIKQDYDKAENHYLKALSADPENANCNGNYASFLYGIKKDYDKAEDYYLKAISIDSENAINNGNYANFLKDIKKDYDKAEDYYLKALSIDSENSINNGNYASFLHGIKKDYENAEKYYTKTLALDPENASTNGSYAIFLESIKKDYEKAENHYLKALSAEPGNANNIGNYAHLLLITSRKKEATKYLEKAFQHNGNEKNGLLAELWFYRYAHYPEFLEKSEKAIEKLLKEGVKSIGWNLDSNIEIAIKNGHPNPEKLKELALRITKIED